MNGKGIACLSQDGQGVDQQFRIIGTNFVWAFKTAHKDFIIWTDDTWAAFKQFKKTLMRAPSLGLPDPMRSSELFPYAKDGPAACEQSRLQCC